MTPRLKSLVGLKESVVLLLIQSVKVHIPSEFNSEKYSFSCAIYYVPQLCSLPVLNYVARAHVK